MEDGSGGWFGSGASGAGRAVRVEGRELLPPGPAVLISNHQSAMDIVTDGPFDTGFPGEPPLLSINALIHTE